MTKAAFGETIPEIPTNVRDYLIIPDVFAYGVTKRIALATPLATDRPFASESYRVVNYGAGGHQGTNSDGMGYYAHIGHKNVIADSAKGYYTHTGDRY